MYMKKIVWLENLYVISCYWSYVYMEERVHRALNKRNFYGHYEDTIVEKADILLCLEIPYNACMGYFKSIVVLH